MNLIKRLVKGSRLSAEDHDYNLNTIEAEFTTVLKKAGYTGTAKDLENRIQQFKAILDTDDADLDTLQKIVDFIKANRDDLQSISVDDIAGLSASLATKVDQQTGKALSTNDLTDQRLQILEKAIQKDTNGSQLRFFNETGNAVAVPTSSYATTIFIDSSIDDSTEAVLNERTQPFKTMLDGKNALTGTESAIRFHFINDGLHQGCELQQIDTEFNADSTATIDFTNVNVGTSVIDKNYNLYFTPTFHFVAGRVSIASNVNGTITDHAHSFTPQYASHHNETDKYKVIISGHIGKIDWKALPEPYSGINYTGNFLFATGTTDLIIDEFVSSDPQSTDRIFAADDYSTIVFRKVSHLSGSRVLFRNYLHSSGIGTKWFINSAIINSGAIRILSLTTFKSITGSGSLSCPSIHFDNCHVDTSIDMNFGNASYLTGRITSNAHVRSSYTSSSLVIENFEGHVQSITFYSINSNCGIRFKGNNKIYLKGTSNMASVNGISDGHLLEVVQVLDGITIIEQEDPTGTIFTGNNGNKVMKVHAVFKTNSQNIGLAKNQLNNN
jgi:hypothetical protein